MKCSKLFILAAVLFFGTAYGQKSSKPKPVKEEVVYKDTDKVDKEVDFSKGGMDGFRKLLMLNTDLDKIDGYEDFPEEEKKKSKNLFQRISLLPQL